MGQDEINTSIAHVVLFCVAGNSMNGYSGRNYTQPGMHANFFIHGILGFLHFQSGMFGSDFGQAYGISLKASKYLPLPCLMADLYRGHGQGMSMIHLASGLVPFALALSGQENAELGNMMIACNIVSLCYYSYRYHRESGWYQAAAAAFAYFFSPKMPKMMYPLGLAVIDYFESHTIF